MMTCFVCSEYLPKQNGCCPAKRRRAHHRFRLIASEACSKVARKKNDDPEQTFSLDIVDEAEFVLTSAALRTKNRAI
jgi:hypothetical protein